MVAFFQRLFKKKDENFRVTVIFLFVVFLFVAVLMKFFLLQILYYEKFAKKADSQRQLSSSVEPERGKIFLVDRFNKSFELATNGKEYEVFAIPKEIENKEEFARLVSELLEVDYDVILKRISKKDDPYEPVKSKVSEEDKLKLDALNLKGLGFKETVTRVYPQGSLASHVSGFLSKKNDNGVGQYGIEEYFNKELSGKPGFFSGEKDTFKFALASKEVKKYSAINGSYVFLSLDPNVQFKIEDELKAAVEKWEAESGSVIVMDPKTGRILGMANYPNFDPNKYYEQKDISVFQNKAVSSQYEPGSIFKPITMAIGIDVGAVTPKTVYEDKGYVSLSGYTIRNYDGKARGEKNMTEVLEESLNTGTVFVVSKIDKDVYLDYVKNFGFGEKTNIDLPAEAKGNIKNLYSKRDINFATASFGQGIAVTPIQIVSAISAIANGGVLMRPHVVDQIFHADGSKEYTKPQKIRRVVSEDTAKKVQTMLVSVVENGFDKAKIPGYFVAGKTGTAQIPNYGKKGYSEDTIHSFVGFAPAYDAKFTVLIKLEKPKGVRFASQSLLDPFKNIMKFLLNYYEVPPDYQ